MNFEHAIISLLISLGFAIESQTSYADYGADFVAAKGDVTFAILLKPMPTPTRITTETIAIAEDAREFYRAKLAIVVTNQRFSPDAKKFARQLGIILWDGNYIETLKLHEHRQWLQKARAYHQAFH